MLKPLLLLLTVFLLTQSLSAQMDVVEKDHNISRKARKGFLGAIEANPAKNTFDLIFVLKSTSSKVITETYTFDKDLSLINTIKNEDEVERVKQKYKWFKFKGETYESKSVFVRANAKQEMVLREKTIRYK